MRVLLTFLVITSFCHFTLAREKPRTYKADSLRTLLRQPALPDTSRVKALASLCTETNRTNTQEAQRMAQQALALAQKIHFRRGEVYAYNALAATAFYAADLLKAQRYFTQCLAVATETGVHRLQGHAYLGLGNVAGGLGDVNRAVGYFEQSLRAYEQCKPPNLVGQAIALNNTAGYLLNEGRVREAARPLRKGLGLAHRLGDVTMEIWSLANLGRLQKVEGHPDSAVVTWHEARRKAHATTDYLTEVQVLINEAELWLDRGQAARALPLTQEAVRLARLAQSPRETQWALDYLARAMHALRMPAAFDTLLASQTLQDSISSEERQKNIAQLQVKFDVAQQQARIKDLEQQRRIGQLRAERQEARTRLFGFVSAGLLVIVVGGSILIGLLVRSRRRLQTSETALRAANDTQEQLMRIIGHDLRAPVASFQQLAPLLHQVVGQPDPADAHQLIQLLDAGSQQLGALVDNLLHWTRVRSGLVATQPARLHLQPVLHGLVSLYEPVALLKGVHLVLHVPADVKVWADQDLLATVLRNLISNAIKFTPSGGTVTLSVTPTSDGSELAVRDTGVGVPPSRLTSLFVAERADSTLGTNGESGTGLGLPLCARFVRLLDSELLVESVVGQGSRFWFRLPAAPEASARPLAAVPRVQQTP